MTTLWDTTGQQVIAALIAERRAAGAVATGLALSLVVVTDEGMVTPAERAATVAAQAHPCRVLIVVRRQLHAPDRLDAEVQVGGRLGPGEAVVLRMNGRLMLHAESVVLPLLAPDVPVVTWWVGEPPDEIATDPLGVFAERRVTDCAQAADPLAAMRRRAEDYAPGDTDLAWTRLTPWRALLASGFDSPAARPVSGRVTAAAGNPSAALLCGWLAGRLGVPVSVAESAGPGITEAQVDLVEDDGEPATLAVNRPDGRLATFARTGQPDRQLPLPRREAGDLLAEELRRLTADAVFAESLQVATGVTGLATRSPTRTHVWRDPELAEGAAAR